MSSSLFSNLNYLACYNLLIYICNRSMVFHNLAINIYLLGKCLLHIQYYAIVLLQWHNYYYCNIIIFLNN